MHTRGTLRATQTRQLKASGPADTEPIRAGPLDGPSLGGVRFAGDTGEPPQSGCGSEVLEMSVENMETEDGVVVPASALLRAEHEAEFGSVPGLDDEELADPAELERWAMVEQWGPILALPVRGSRHAIRPELDEYGHLDWGAFGTVDFERLRPAFDKVRYKAHKLREELRDAVIMLGIVVERVPGRAKYLVLKYLRMGIIEAEHIVGPDMQAIAKWYLRVRRLRGELRKLEEAGRGRR